MFVYGKIFGIQKTSCDNEYNTNQINKKTQKTKDENMQLVICRTM